MKNVMMLAAVLTAGLLSSCADGMDPMFGDDALVSSIEEATNKVEVAVDALPGEAQAVLDEEYTDFAVTRALMAPGTGFQVELQRSADLSETVTFFDTEGKELECREGRRGRRRRGRLLSNACFTVVFPVSLSMPDASTITLTSKEDHELVKAWYEANPEAEGRPEIVFPIGVSYAEGNAVTVTSMEELRALQEECRPDGSRCFRLAFPHTVTLPDGSSITLTSEDDKQLVKAWYEANPGIRQRPALVFPVQVVYADGTTATANSQDELMALRQACE